MWHRCRAIATIKTIQSNTSVGGLAVGAPWYTNHGHPPSFPPPGGGGHVNPQQKNKTKSPPHDSRQHHDNNSKIKQPTIPPTDKPYHIGSLPRLFPSLLQWRSSGIDTIFRIQVLRWKPLSHPIHRFGGYLWIPTPPKSERRLPLMSPGVRAYQLLFWRRDRN